MIVRTCTCPMQATRNGFVITGRNALCPFHGDTPASAPESARYAVEIKANTAPAPRDERMLHCEECGRTHAPDVHCDFVDEN